MIASKHLIRKFGHIILYVKQMYIKYIGDNGIV